MRHRILHAKAATALRKTNLLLLVLHRLSVADSLSDADKQGLVRLRQAAHKSMQFAGRLKRRIAKKMDDPHVPALTRARFKKTQRYNAIERTHGVQAATAALFGGAP